MKTDRRIEHEKVAARNFATWSAELPNFKLIPAQETDDDLLRIECKICEVCSLGGAYSMLNSDLHLRTDNVLIAGLLVSVDDGCNGIYAPKHYFWERMLHVGMGWVHKL
jgi:hypothetical protein